MQRRDEQLTAGLGSERRNLVGSGSRDDAGFCGNHASGDHSEFVELPLCRSYSNAIVGAQISSKPPWRREVLDRVHE